MRTLENSQSALVKAAIGWIAGGVATGPMTVAMILWHRRLPPAQRYPLPPREITEKLEDKAGLKGGLSEPAESAATLLAHFGYGAAAGLLYALLAGKVRVPRLATGVAFGLAVWTVSYLGVLPGAGVLKSAAEHPAKRNLLMIAAHVIWGAVLGFVVQLFEEETTPAGSRALIGRTAPLMDVQGEPPEHTPAPAETARRKKS